MKKIITILLILLLTGCYDYKELNDLAIISGISISKENNLYKTTIEVLNQSKENYIIYTGIDSTIQESIKKITKESPKKLYFDHNNILIIDEDLAKENLYSIINYFKNNKESRNDFYILLSKNKDILSKSNKNNISSKDILESLLENKKYLGISNSLTYDELLNNYLNKNIDLTIPSIEYKNNKVYISTIAIFKNNKFITYLSENDSLIYNLLKNNINKITLKINYNNNYIITEIINTKCKINIKNNTININLKGNGNILELNHKDNINNIEKALNKELTNKIYNNITNIYNNYQSDIYGFKDLYYKNNTKYSKNINIKTNVKIIDEYPLIGDTNDK